MLVHDAWLLLAGARRLRAEGRFSEAIEHYQRAELAFDRSDAAQICRDERQAVSVWFGEQGPQRREWWSLLRSAVAREPLTVARSARELAGANGRLTEGLAALLAGELGQARQTLAEVSADGSAGELSRATAATAAAVADLLAGDAQAAVKVEAAVAAAENLGLEWLARLGRASLAIGGSEEALREALAVAAACAAADDGWGAALAQLFAAWGAVYSGRDGVELERLSLDFRALGAPVLEAWTRGLTALALWRAGDPEAHAAALAAEAMARSVGVPNVRLFSHVALGELAEAAADDDADEYRELAQQISHESGLALPTTQASAPPTVPAPYTNGHAKHAPPPIEIRLLGGYSLAMDGRPVDLGVVRPRVRALLRLLSLNAFRPIHHETIEAALWPDVDAAAASRNLHVAVAALRRAMEPTAGRGEFQLVRREGDAYRLALPANSRVDLAAFEQALTAGRAAREHGDAGQARRFFEEALDAYRGELLPEDGPAEWVVERRERCRLAAVEAAEALAELLLDAGEAEAAARVCARGLRIERYHDPLWRLLIRAREAAGDQGAALRARRSYNEMLADLGVEANYPLA
jgi:DNA-binding SARP family transcriptional activator